MHHAVGFDPGEELAPPSIVIGLGEVAILDQVADLRVFKGNQIARGDKRVRLLAGEIFTLPLHLQMRFGQLFPGFVTVRGSLFLAGKLPMQFLELLFSEAHVVGVLHCVAVRRGREGFQAHIDAGLFAGRHMGDMALDVVSICPSHDSHPFDLLEGEGFDLLSAIAD